MLKYEFKKLFQSKLFVILFALLLLLNIGLCYRSAKEVAGSVTLEPEILEQLDAYNRDSVAWQTEYERLGKVYEEYENARRQAFEQAYAEYKKENPNASSFSYIFPAEEYFDSAFLADISKHWDCYQAYAILQELDEYEADVGRVVRAARMAQEDYLASGVSEQAYEYRYQGDLIRIYEVNALIEIEYEYAVGWDSYFSYTDGNVLMAILVTVAAVGLCIGEYTSGMLPILHATKGGRVRTVLCKLGVLLGVCAGVVLVFSAVPLVLFGSMCGFSSLGNFVQVFEAYKFCPEIITVGEYLALSLGLKTLVLFALSACVVLLGTLCKDYALTFVASLGVVAAQFALYFFVSVEQFGSYHMLNIFNAMDTHSYFTRYYSLNLFGSSAAFIPTLLAFYVLAAVALCIGAGWAFCRTRGARRLRKGIKLRLPATAVPLIGRTLIGAELHKLLVGHKLAIIIAAVLIAKLLISSGTYVYQSSFTDSVYHEYMTTLAGEVTEEKLQYIEEERERIDEAGSDAKFSQMMEAHQSGKITSEEYAQYFNEYEYAQERTEHLKRIEGRRDYLQGLAEQGKEGHFVYDTGWNALFDGEFDFLLYALVLLSFAGVFADEYRRGAYQILRPSKRGRAGVLCAKYAAATLLTLGVFAAFAAIDLGFVLLRFELPMWTAPIQSLPGFAAMPDMTIAQGLIAWLAVKGAAYLLMAMMLLCLSLVTKSVLGTSITVAMVTLLPYFMRRFGMEAASGIDYTYLLDGTTFLQSFAQDTHYMTYLTILVAVICLLTLCALVKWLDFLPRKRKS